MNRIDVIYAHFQQQGLQKQRIILIYKRVNDWLVN